MYDFGFVNMERQSSICDNNLVLIQAIGVIIPFHNGIELFCFFVDEFTWHTSKPCPYVSHFQRCDCHL